MFLDILFKELRQPMDKISSFRKNDIVRFIPEYEDGEQEFDYVLIEDPDEGRVKVMPINSGLEFPPSQVVNTEWLVLKTG